MIRTAFAWALIACFAAAAQAAVIVSVDLDRNASGVQSNLEVVAGQEIQGSLILEVVGEPITDMIFGYSFSLRFRTDELDLKPSFDIPDIDPATGQIVVLTQPGQPTPPPLLGGGNMAPITFPIERVFLEDEGLMFNFTDDTNGPANPGRAGIFRNIDAGTLGSFGTPGGTIASIYEFNMTAVNPSGDQSILDVVPVILQGGGFLGLNDTALPRNEITLLGASVSLTTVPEPSFMALVGVGMLYAGHRRRTSKNRRAGTSA